MESYEVVSPYHFRMHLLEPYTKMVFTLAGGEGGMMISKKYYEAVGYDYAIIHPIGTGPWRLIDHKPAEYFKYEAVENHWRVTPEFKYLKIVGVPELSTRLAMLKTGAGDLAEVPIEFADDLRDAGLHIKTQTGAGAGNLLLGGNVLPTREGYDPTCPWVPHQDEAEAVADHAAGWGKVTGGSEWNQRALKVRMAMTYAIDRDAIIEGIFYGQGVTNPIGAAGGWGAYDSVWSRPEWEPFPYDPELSRQLLIEAGYPDGFELTMVMHVSDQQPKLMEIAEAVSRDFEAIGLTVERWKTEYIVQRPIWGARESAGMVKIDAYPPYPEPWMSIIYCLYTKNTAYSDGTESLALDALVEKAANTSDFDERLEAILEMGDWFYAQYLVPPIVLTNRLFALSPKVKDWPIVQPGFTVGGSPIRDLEYATRAD